MINLDDYFLKDDKWLFNELKKIKQDVLPDNFKLTVSYLSDRYNNPTSPGIAISKLQELLVLVDFPNFFVEIHTTNKQIQQELSLVKQLYCPFESDINYKIIPGNFNKTIATKDTLCVLPWMHLYVNPQGYVGPCCNFDEKYPIGHISKNSLNEIANDQPLRDIRLQMLQGLRPDSCTQCWDKEDFGLTSARQNSNQKFKHHLSLTTSTKKDGTVDDFKLRYLDFRASNVCNLKCRMCGGKFSSRIAKEEQDLYNNSKFIELKLTSIEIDDTLKYIEENIEYIESVYFAGGEPLIMEEHYRILDLLLKYQKTNVELFYNTNLTRLNYKKYNILDYWTKFSLLK